MRQLPRLKDDGLHAPEVGRWAEQKYRLVATYAGMFATGMKKKWEKRIYIDLFAGAGRSRIEIDPVLWTPTERSIWCPTWEIPRGLIRTCSRPPERYSSSLFVNSPSDAPIARASQITAEKYVQGDGLTPEWIMGRASASRSGG